MKKNTIAAGILFALCNIISAQTIHGINFGEQTKPVPSVSSLSTYVDTPSSVATGIPEIGFPLAELPTYDNNIKISLGLSYHAGNTGKSEAASDVGAGWTLAAGGVISRQISSWVDEWFDDTSKPDYQKNTFDDFYYYNFPEGSGKFRFVRDVTNNTFSIEKFTPDNIKIEYTRENNTATLIPASFTLTDGRGYRYIFNDYSVSTREYGSINQFSKEYKSAFFLSKIINPSGLELVNFTYQKDPRYASNNSRLLYKSCKLKIINSIGWGSAQLDYNYSSLEEPMNDPYSLSRIIIQNTQNRQIAKYTFTFGSTDFHYPGEIQNKRTLSYIAKYEGTSTKAEITNFEYDMTGSDTEYTPSSEPFGDYLCSPDYDPAHPPVVMNPNMKSRGILKTVHLPTGGFTEYSYEANQHYMNKNTPDYISGLNSLSGYIVDPEIQYLKNIKHIHFDSYQTRNYTFQVTGTPGVPKKVYFQGAITGPSPTNPYHGSSGDPVLADPPNTAPNFNFYTISSTQNGFVGYLTNCLLGTKYVTLYPGAYMLRINTDAGFVEGDMDIYAVENISPPYRNASSMENMGVRIKSITMYEKYGGAVQSKTTYEYNDFGYPQNSSGQFMLKDYIEDGAVADDSPEQVLYKNVKVTQIGKGYIKYYFKTPQDFISAGSASQNIPYYNLTKAGVLDQMETYDLQNNLVNAKLFENEYETLTTAPEYTLSENSGYGISGSYTSKPAWLKYDKLTDRLYNTTTQTYLETKTENTYNPLNYSLSSSKTTAPGGNITEQFTKYAHDRGNTALINANMISIPLETENKINGKAMGKTETRYDGANLLLPSSQILTNPINGSVKTAVRYDSYDSKGNLNQFTANIDESGKGFPTTVIWGYNQTLPIARIEGAKFSDIASLAADIISKSDTDVDSTSENMLISALDTFRSNPALRDFRITTYTYDPMVGVTSATSPSGVREYYKYDENNRLKAVHDAAGKILCETKYNIQTP